MTLKEYIDQNSIPHLKRQKQWAEFLGIPAPYLSDILNGKRTPGREVMERIYFATDRAVKPETFFSDNTNSPA